MVSEPWGTSCRDGKDMADNVLSDGDHRDILRRYLKDGIVDLVYLDPPFESHQNYNVQRLMREH
jgi:hypothetical protein